MSMMETAADTFAEWVSLGEIDWAGLNARGLGVTNPQSPYLDQIEAAFKTIDFFLGEIDASPAEWDAAYADPKGVRDSFMKMYRKIEKAVPDALEDPGGLLLWAIGPQIPIDALKRSLMLFCANLTKASYQHMGGEVRTGVELDLVSQYDAEKSASLIVAGANALRWLGEHSAFDAVLRHPMSAPTATHGFGQAEPLTLSAGVIILIGIVAILYSLVILGVAFLLVSGLVLGKIVDKIADMCDKLIERGATPEQVKETCIDPLSKMAPNLSDALKPISSALSGLVWITGICAGIFVLAKVGPDIVDTIKEARA